MSDDDLEKRTDTKPCRECFKPIHKQARRCPYCRTSQGAFRHLAASATVLALLVALISVTQSAAPIIRDAMREEQTRFSVELLNQTDEVVSFLIQNRGTTIGTVGSASLRLDQTYCGSPFELIQSEGKTLLEPADVLEVKYSADPNGYSKDPDCERAGGLPEAKSTGSIRLVLFDENGIPTSCEFMVPLFGESGRLVLGTVDFRQGSSLNPDRSDENCTS